MTPEERAAALANARARIWNPVTLAFEPRIIEGDLTREIRAAELRGRIAGLEAAAERAETYAASMARAQCSQAATALGVHAESIRAEIKKLGGGR